MRICDYNDLKKIKGPIQIFDMKKLPFFKKKKNKTMSRTLFQVWKPKATLVN